MSTTARRSCRCGITLALIGFWCAAPAAGQRDELITQGKQLYAAAAYEEALAIFARSDGVEGLRYRTLSLLALDRPEDARRAAEALVIASPGVMVSASDDPPRFVTTVNDAKRRVLPQILRGMVAEGSKQFQAKQYEDALQQFRRVSALLSDPAVDHVDELKDLHVLSEGFMELAKANVRPLATVTPSPSPLQAQTPVEVKPPVALRQTMPPWPSTLFRSATAAPGAVTIVIGPDGRVKDASITVPMHPVYDRTLLNAARGWLYKPALRNGVPIEMTKVVSVKVVPGASVSNVD